MSPAEQPEDRPLRRLLPLFRVGAWVLWCAVLLATGTGFLGGVAWWLELACHFRVQYLLAGVGLLGLFAVLRSWRGALAAAVLVAINGAVIADRYLPASGDAGGPPPGSAAAAQAGDAGEHLVGAGGGATLGAPVPPRTLRLLLANVNTRNRNPAPLLALVESERPDLLLLEETDEAWVAALAPLEATFPHRVSRPRADNFGILAWSRVPFESAEVSDFGGAGLPSIVLRFQNAGRPCNLLLTHPLPPTRPALSRLRNAQLRAVAAAAAALGPGTILVGDLNTTPWSPVFAEVLRTSGLRDSGRGRGVQASWPTMLPAVCRIPIDHCLHSPDLTVVDRRLGAHIGSDHLPLIVDLR